MPHGNYWEVFKNITYSHPERCSQLSEPSLQMQLCYILQLCWDWKQIENFIFKWLFKPAVRKFHFITFPIIRKLHVLFDIIKLSSYHKAKHRFYFLKAYVIELWQLYTAINNACDEIRSPQSWAPMENKTNNIQKTEIEIPLKASEIFCPEHFSIQQCFPMCLYLQMHFSQHLLCSPEPFAHLFFSAFRGRKRTQFSITKLSVTK